MSWADELEEELEELELELEELELEREQSLLLRDEDNPRVEYDLPCLPAAAKVKTVAIKVETKTTDFIVVMMILKWWETSSFYTFSLSHSRLPAIKW